MIADRAGPTQIHEHNIPGNPGLASLPPGTPGAAPLRPESDKRVRHRLLETVMSYAASDSAPLNASARRVRWRLHGVPAGLLRTVGTLGGDVTSRMAARSASPRQASSDRSLLPRGTLSRAAESRLVSTLRSTATIAHPSVGT